MPFFITNSEPTDSNELSNNISRSPVHDVSNPINNIITADGNQLWYDEYAVAVIVIFRPLSA